jgi:tRNA 2-thiouridine synthesizing protein C
VITKRFLFICRRPPYGSSLAREALDVALAAAAFDQPVAMLFLGDGVLQLLPQQKADAIDQKPLDKQLGALPLYDIDQLYVDADALQARKLSLADLAQPAQPLSVAEITALMAVHDVVLGF